MKTTLTKREYLGEGFFHNYINVNTGEVRYTETTKEQYESMGGVDGYLNNPKDEGEWKWKDSVGGAIKVDSPSLLLSENEGTILPNGLYVVYEKNILNNIVLNYYSEEEFNSKYIWQ